MSLILVGSFLCIVAFNECITVGLKHEIENYPWGMVNENPWYYETPEIYAKVMFVEGVVLLVSLLNFTYQKIKGTEARYKFSKYIVLSLIVLSFISSHIQ